jgi:hypothetical protein
VPSVDEIRRAEFKLLGLGWEIVDSEGLRAGLTSAGQIPVNSINQVLRRAQATREPNGQPPVRPTGTSAGEPAGPTPMTPAPTGGIAPAAPEPLTPPPLPDGAVTYKRYRVRLDNLSVTSPKREDRRGSYLASWPGCLTRHGRTSITSSSTSTSR